MSTTSTVGILEKNNTVTGVFVQWDGYVQHLGILLDTFYNTEEKVRKLISLGSLSSVGYEPNYFFKLDDKKIYKDNYYQYTFGYYTNPYQDNEIQNCSLNAFKQESYCYVFYPKENKWMMCGGGFVWTELKEAIAITLNNGERPPYRKMPSEAYLEYVKKNNPKLLKQIPAWNAAIKKNIETIQSQKAYQNKHLYSDFAWKAKRYLDEKYMFDSSGKSIPVYTISEVKTDTVQLTPHTKTNKQIISKPIEEVILLVNSDKLYLTNPSKIKNWPNFK